MCVLQAKQSGNIWLYPIPEASFPNAHVNKSINYIYIYIYNYIYIIFAYAYNIWVLAACPASGLPARRLADTLGHHIASGHLSLV